MARPVRKHLTITHTRGGWLPGLLWLVGSLLAAVGALHLLSWAFAPELVDWGPEPWDVVEGWPLNAALVVLGAGLLVIHRRIR